MRRARGGKRPNRLTKVAPLAAVVFTPGTRRPIPKSESGRYLFCSWRWACYQIQSSRCKPCALTSGEISSVAEAESMRLVASSPSAASTQWYGLVTVRRKWARTCCNESCWSQISRAVVLRPKRRVQRAVSGGKDFEACYRMYVSVKSWRTGW